MNKLKYFLIAGYGWSGSSAAVDLLREFEGNWESCVEFRAIKDPYGVHDLYRNLVEEWDVLNSDNAIRDFLWHMQCLEREQSKLSTGLNYGNLIGKHFMDAAVNFVNKLVEFKYESSWWFPQFKKTKSEVFREKVNRKLFNKSNNTEPYMYFSKIDETRFIECAQEFLDEVYSDIAEKNSASSIILDQAVSIPNCIQQMKYFRDAKLIIIDRDPRDIYLDLIREKGLIGRELAKTRNVDMYIKWHLAMRSNIGIIKENPNILLLQFEDLVCDYENTVSKIVDFLELDSKLHCRKKQYFEPSISIKNVGIWKEGLTKEEKEVFETKLGDFLVNEQN